MKIGIISINMYSKGLNFACPLHTYAFQQFLLNNGIPCTILSYKPNYYEGFNLRHPYDYYKMKYEAKLSKAETITDPEEKKLYNEDLKYFKDKMDLWKPLQKEREIRCDKFQRIIDQHYIRTKKCYDSDLLEVDDPEFDCYIFSGWRIRIQIDHRWFWIRSDNTLMLRKDIETVPLKKLHVFRDEDVLPYIPVNHISYMIAEAIWEPFFPLNVLQKIWRRIKVCFTHIRACHSL